MVKLYFNPSYKYTNRTLIDVSSDTDFIELDYENIDSPDTINGHIIYEVEEGLERLPTYLVQANGWRWFVSGITQLRTGKYQISLLRDIASENPEQWKQESAYIEAGTAKDGDYCKYKKWGLPFTNTKVGQQRLDFGGKSSFFVFYVNEKQENGGATSEQDFTVNYTTLPGVLNYDVSVNSLNEIPHFDFVGSGAVRSWSEEKGSLVVGYTQVFSVGGHPKTKKAKNVIQYSSNLSSNNYYLDISYGSGNIDISNCLYFGTQGYIDWSTNPGNITADTSTSMRTFLRDLQTSQVGVSQPQAYVDELDGYIDKIIKVGTHYYKITSEKQVIPHNQIVFNYYTTPLTTLLKTNSKINSYNPTDRGLAHFVFQSTEVLTTYTLHDLGEANSFSYTFKADTRKLPKSSVRCVNIVPDADASPQLIMQTLMMAQANPNVDDTQNVGRIIDVQYLPFSVARNKNANFVVDSTQLTAEFLDNDDFIYNTVLPNRTNINKETDSIVIVSPSRKSQFKFSPYNTDGKMIFDTKITIRPNQSIIYVRPTTQGLLLQDWDDKECLIIQEDFSLTQVGSAWTEYVYNNRNFQNAFNLQMETKEFERSWERRIEQEQAKSDTWTARNISAQKASTYTGNIPIISNIASAFGTAFQDTTYMQMAQLDREYNEALYQKSMEVARTQFSYQIENIKSQPLIPNTITVIDVKMLDGIYLEFYSTNFTEKQSINDYYKYNGNRIENYGNFDAYWGYFVKGRIIISYTYTQPEIDELNRRLELGLFTEVI
jgi:hypothetical protein